MLEKLSFALEKIAALLTSQRTITTVAGIIVLVLMFWAVIAPLVGMEAGELPDEDQLTESVGQWATIIATAITGLVSVLALVSKLVGSVESHPPTLMRGDYEGVRKQ